VVRTRCTVRIVNTVCKIRTIGDVNNQQGDVNMVQHVCKLEGFFRNLLKFVICREDFFCPQKFSIKNFTEHKFLCLLCMDDFSPIFVFSLL
jgi:hypothetical protein